MQGLSGLLSMGGMNPFGGMIGQGMQMIESLCGMNGGAGGGPKGSTGSSSQSGSGMPSQINPFQSLMGGGGGMTNQMNPFQSLMGGTNQMSPF